MKDKLYSPVCISIQSLDKTYIVGGEGKPSGVGGKSVGTCSDKVMEELFPIIGLLDIISLVKPLTQF